MAFELKFPDKIQKRIDDNKIIEQKIWSYIKELNSFDEEHLNAVAIFDGFRKYTYRQMFRKWDEYAEVFSSLGITEKNRSRVGLLPFFSSESLFALYSLNITGASISLIHYFDVIDKNRWKSLIEKEGITDLVICDMKITSAQLKKIIDTKEELGIRNIIVIHNSGKNKFVTPDVLLKDNETYRRLKKIKGLLFMDKLLEKYEAYPISIGSKTSKDDAVILHTSGTTNGVHKPVPFSDRGFNEATARLLRSENFNRFEKRVVGFLMMDITSAYALLDMVHLPFAFGGGVVIVPGGMFNPISYSLIKKYNISILFSSPKNIDELSDLPITLDLSGIEFVFSGGSFLSPEIKKKGNRYLKKCGSKARISIGYGATEIGGACILSSPDSDDSSMGTPLPGVKVKIYDEEEKKYYNIEDGPRTGVLLVSSPSVSSGKLNGITFFENEIIDGEEYLNTYDLVSVNENGTLTCIGRMNKYFVNNEGIRFDAGLVETAVSAEKGIKCCGLVPGYNKLLHDTVPVLFVQTNTKGNKEETVRKALVKVFITDNNIKKTNMPLQCVISDNIPCNEAGKVDIYRIQQGEDDGRRYEVIPVRKDDKVVDIKFAPAQNSKKTGLSFMRVVPDELKDEFEELEKLRRKQPFGPKEPGHFPPSGNLNQEQKPNMPFGFNPQGSGQQGSMPFMPFMPFGCNVQGNGQNAMPNIPFGIGLPQIIQFFQGLAMMQYGNINGMYMNNAQHDEYDDEDEVSEDEYDAENDNTDNDDDEVGNNNKNMGGLMNNPMLSNIMSRLFNASQKDQYFED